MSSAAARSDVTNLGVARARRLLNDLKSHPFIAFVFVDGQISVYCKDMPEEDREYLQSMLDDLNA